MARRELTVQQWQDEIDSGLEFRKQHGLEDSWVDLEAHFYNVRDDQKTPGPNIIFSTGDSLLSQLSTPNPYIMVKPLRMDSVDGAPIIERLDNILLNTLNLREEIDTAVLHAYLFGRGFIKLGFDSEWGFDPKFLVDESDNSTLTQFDDKGRMIEFSGARPGMPWALSAHPRDIVVPWGTRKMETSPWCTHRVVRHIDDIRKDLKYSGTRNLKPTMSREDYMKSYESSPSPFRRSQSMMGLLPSTGSEGIHDYVELWEIHDRRTSKVLVIATGHDRFLRNDIDLIQVHGLPFVEIGFTPSTRALWVTPPAHYILYHQTELLDIKLQQQKQRRMSVLKFLVPRNLLKPEEAKKLLSADVGAYVEVDGSPDDVQKAVKVFQPGDNTGLMYEEVSVRRAARESIGFSQNQQGEFDSSSRRTATEAGIVAEASNVRMDRRQLAVADAYKLVMVKINALIFEFWKTPRAVDIMGEDMAPKWEQFTGQSLKGDYLYKVSFSDEPADTLVNRESLIAQLYSALVADPGMDPVAIRQMLMNAFNDPRISSAFRKEITSSAGVSPQVSQQGVQGSIAGRNQPNSGTGQPTNLPQVRAQTGA